MDTVSDALWLRKIAILEAILADLVKSQGEGAVPSRSVADAEIRLIDAKLEYLEKQK